jgi:site-specific recombinase XerD
LRHGEQLLTAVRGVLRECWRLGLLDGDAYQRVRDVGPVKGTTLPAGRCLDAGELLALFRVCAADSGPAGPRDAAMLAMGFACGLRRAELVALDVSDYNQETGEVSVRHGKGNRSRVVWAQSAGAVAALADWLAVRGDQPGKLFLQINKSGFVSDVGMGGQSLRLMLARRAEQAGVASFAPHDLRRSFATALFDEGVDGNIVQRLMGHASPVTTAVYDRRPEAAKKTAAGRLHTPYVSRRVMSVTAM